MGSLCGPYLDSDDCRFADTAHGGVGGPVQAPPSPGRWATSFADYMVLGMIMTAMPAINAIPAVCAAPPGIVTYLDLPLPAPAGWVPQA